MKATAGRRIREGAIDLTPFKRLLLRSCGHSFEKEREQALLTALCRRMTALKIDACETYQHLLTGDRQELLRLTELLTVKETYFFREPEHLNLIVDRLLPEFVAARSQRPIRILSAGCSTGEEAYSIAILLRERFGPECEKLFAITGMDIDSNAIAAAREGEYGKLSFRWMDPLLLERYFEPRASGRFQLREAIRKQVDFEVANLLATAYPQTALLPDIILYRNVSIYFPEPVQREVFGNLAGLLAEGGCLIVGVSETIHHDFGILPLVKQDGLFYYRKTPGLVNAERQAAGRYSLEPARSAPGRPVTIETTMNRPQTGNLQPSPRKLPQVPRQREGRERFDAAVALARQLEYEKALALLDAIVAQDGNFEEARCLQASLLLSLGKFAEAEVVCTAVLSRNPLCKDAYLMLGMIARQQGDDPGAGRRFREVIYLEPSCWLAHFYTAELLCAQGNRQRARSSYEAVLKILEKGYGPQDGPGIFPLAFDAEQFMFICRHKLSRLKENG